MRDCRYNFITDFCVCMQVHGISSMQQGCVEKRINQYYGYMHIQGQLPMNISIVPV